MFFFPLLLLAAACGSANAYDPAIDHAEVIGRVNAFRRDHMVNDVAWDADLAAYAGTWANDLASRMALEHRPDSPYGENIALLEADNATAAVKLATDLWYVEVENYDFAAPGFSIETGHFTQLCWADTARVGAGVGRNGDLLFVVMNFDPPGNYLGTFEANVFPKMQLAPATPLSPSPPSPPPSPDVIRPPVNITLGSGKRVCPKWLVTLGMTMSVALLLRFALQ